VIQRLTSNKVQNHTSVDGGVGGDVCANRETPASGMTLQGVAAQSPGCAYVILWTLMHSAKLQRQII
jgi:hypothetical protein